MILVKQKRRDVKIGRGLYHVPTLNLEHTKQRTSLQEKEYDEKSINFVYIQQFISPSTIYQQRFFLTLSLVQYFLRTNLSLKKKIILHTYVNDDNAWLWYVMRFNKGKKKMIIWERIMAYHIRYIYIFTLPIFNYLLPSLTSGSN